MKAVFTKPDKMAKRFICLVLVLASLFIPATSVLPGADLWGMGVTAEAVGYAPTRVLRVQSRLMSGEDVKWVQSNLNAYFGWNRLEVDGVYGNASKNACTDFQRAMGIDADGIWGSQTTGKMQEWLNNQTASDSATTDGSAKENAQKILDLNDQGKFWLYTEHACGRSGDGATAYDNIVDIRDGKSEVKRSDYQDGNLPKAPGGTTTLDPNILKILLDLQEKYSNKQIIVTAIAGSCHSGGSKHYSGKAVDFQVKGTSALCTWNQGKEIFDFLKGKGYDLGDPFGGSVYENQYHYHIQLN